MEWADVTGWLRTDGVRILIIILVTVVLVYGLKRLTQPLFELASRKQIQRKGDEAQKRIKTLSRITVGVGAAIITIAAVFMILSAIGIDIMPMLAGFGIAGIAIGFGAQSLVKDLIAGFFIIAEGQYYVGDVVKTANISGVVEEINLRRTVLRDLDGIVHVIPNGEITVASNYTRDWSRTNLNISVAYDTDLDYAISIINRVCAEMAEEEYWSELIIKTPSVLRVDNLGDSGIDIKVLGDTKPIRQWEVTGELRKRIKRVFDEEGIEIPWPHTKIYFGNPLPPTPKGKAAEPPPPVEEIPSEPPQEHPPEVPREFQSPEVLPPDDEAQDEA
ncbi:MAG: mechanosensitive ion channel family protein [Chloroflexota bacterium]|nr:mechanosensitive ion channel family protein [Chloroflexota bacterium]